MNASGTAILYLLTSASGGATGAIVGENVFPDDLPQAPPYPCIVYQQISGPRGYTMDGPDGCTPFRYQVDCYAATVDEVRALADAVVADLSGFAGDVPLSPPVRIFGIFADNERDSALPSLETAGPRTRERSLDFIVWTQEG